MVSNKEVTLVRKALKQFSCVRKAAMSRVRERSKLLFLNVCRRSVLLSLSQAFTKTYIHLAF